MEISKFTLHVESVRDILVIQFHLKTHMKKQHQLCNLPKVSDFKVALKNLTLGEAYIGEKAQIYLHKSYNCFPK